MNEKVITPQDMYIYEAMKRMRVLTSAGIPFSIEFLSYNDTTGASEGFKKVDGAQLRMGYRNDQSDKANVLIGYVHANDQNRWFYLPLLVKFNGHNIYV